MDVTQTFAINGAAFPVHNDTDYHLGMYLDSDYGFELFWRKQSGMAERDWQFMLKHCGFNNPDKALRVPYWYAETRITELPLVPLMRRTFVTHFVFGGEWYGIAFDGKQFIVQANHNNLFLPSVML
jgi:hypothetical protein